MHTFLRNIDDTYSAHWRLFYENALYKFTLYLLTITQLVQEIYPISSRITGSFLGRAMNDVRKILPRPNNVAMAKKFKT